MIKPWLFLPASTSHSIGPFFLRQWAKLKKRPKPKSTFKLLGLEFHSPFGTAGGLDKSGKDLFTWQKYGAGFIEAGTFTPEPQGPNPGKIMDRSVKHKAIWNCMGFPNAGFKSAMPKLIKYKKQKGPKPPLFVNIGKNRSTPLDKAHEDYVKGIHFFADVADVFVVNISSPNTKDLRLLHEKENFKNFIEPILKASKEQVKKVPILVKLSPDLDNNTFEHFIKDLNDVALDGLILTNTTTRRPEGVNFPERGGLSGKPLAPFSIEKLKLARKILGYNSNKILISVGGLCTPEDAVERINLGADLAQVYSGLIFYGPGLFKDAAAKLRQ